jgi:hypothetical protein
VTEERATYDAGETSYCFEGVPRGAWTAIPVKLMREAALHVGNAAFKLLYLIAERTLDTRADPNGEPIGIAWLVKTAKLNRKTVVSGTTELLMKGFITREQRWKREGSTKQLASSYKIRFTDEAISVRPKERAAHEAQEMGRCDPLSGINTTQELLRNSKERSDHSQQGPLATVDLSTSLPPGSGPEKNQDLAAVLVQKYGVYGRKAVRIVESYAPDLVRRHLRNHQYELDCGVVMTNPAGRLVKRIEENWPDPPGAVEERHPGTDAAVAEWLRWNKRDDRCRFGLDEHVFVSRLLQELGEDGMKSFLRYLGEHGNDDDQYGSPEWVWQRHKSIIDEWRRNEDQHDWGSGPEGIPQEDW